MIFYTSMSTMGDKTIVSFKVGSSTHLYLSWRPPSTPYFFMIHYRRDIPRTGLRSDQASQCISAQAFFLAAPFSSNILASHSFSRKACFISSFIFLETHTLAFVPCSKPQTCISQLLHAPGITPGSVQPTVPFDRGILAQRRATIPRLHLDAT